MSDIPTPYVSHSTALPKQGIQTQKCAGCRQVITVDADRPDSYRAMCPPCGEKFVNGELDTVTWYDGGK